MAKAIEVVFHQLLVRLNIEFTPVIGGTTNHQHMNDGSVRGWAHTLIGAKHGTTDYKVLERYMFIKDGSNEWVWLHEFGHHLCNHHLRNKVDGMTANQMEFEANAVALYVYKKMGWKTPKMDYMQEFEDMMYNRVLNNETNAKHYRDNAHSAVRHAGEYLYKKLKERGIK